MALKIVAFLSPVKTTLLEAMT